MISRVAVLPQPPLLVPELIGGDDPDAAAVRAACLAVAGSLAAAASRWVAVGVGEPGSGTAGTFLGYGVDVRVTLRDQDSPASPNPSWPLPSLVAGWLRGQVGAESVDVRLVPADLDPHACAALGHAIAAEPDPVGLLILGDGSHRHGARAVGRPDERAAAFDSGVAAALAGVDTGALLGLEPAPADELGAVGRAPWQVLAGAVDADGRRWHATHAATFVPFGVAYHLALWEPV
ncbi:hypothetical protein ACTG9Q_17260 [Actinokineospora sp. 24-640]